MSLNVELSVEGKIYSVRRYYTIIDRDEDEKGRPKSDPAWTIHLVIDSINDDATITNWMLDPKKLIDGKITLYKIEDGSKVKEIEFKKSSCYKMLDHFNIDRSSVTSFLSISGKDIKINSAELKQRWPGT